MATGPRRIAPDPLVYDRQGDSTTLRPQATPVDTFYSGARPTPVPYQTPIAPTGAAELAQTLAQVNPKIDRFFTQKIDENARADEKAAQISGMTASAKTYQEAIDNGEIQPGQSPLYQRVFAETVGKREGLTEASMTMYNAWNDPSNPDRTSNDPRVIGAFFAKQRDKMLEGKDDNYKAGFLPSVIATQQQLTQKIVAEQTAEVQEKNEAALGQLYFDRIMAGRGKMTPAQLAEQISEDTLPQQFAGLKGSRANAIQAQAIIAAAKTSGNSGLLKVGYEDRPDLKNPGQTIPGVFKTPKYAMAADDAATSILSKANAESSRALMAEARAEKAQAKAFLPELLDYRRKNPDDPNPPAELLDKAARLNIPPTAVQANWAASGKLAPSISYSDKLSGMAAIAEQAKIGGDVQAAILAHPGAVSDDKAFTLLSQGGIKEALNTDAFNTQMKSIDGSIDTFLTKFDRPGAGALIKGAKDEFTARAMETYIDMTKAGKGHVDPKQFNDALTALGTEVIEKMRTKAEPTVAPEAPKPGAKGAATTPTKPSASIASVIPTDSIIPVRADATAHQWPTATAPNANGQQIVQQWTLPPGVAPPDIADINTLRNNPWQANKDLVPVWQRFENTYGPGAVRFFMTNGQQEIQLHLSRMKNTQVESRQSVTKAAKETTKPLTYNAQ